MALLGRRVQLFIDNKILRKERSASKKEKDKDGTSRKKDLVPPKKLD